MRTTTRILNDGWTFREVSPATIPHSDAGGWLPAEVPGYVHLDLMRAGVIDDPFERMHERAVQWVDTRDWEYVCAFTLDEAELGSRHVLRFEGLDTIATVTLNGTELGAVDNMFIAHEFDVTAALQPGDNRLVVRFASAQRVGDERLAATGGVEVAYGYMSRSYVRKAQYMYGWDWGPRLRSCGIWGNVALIRVPLDRVTEWSWAASFEDGAAAVTVRVSGEGGSDSVRATLAGETVEGPVGAPMVVKVPDAQRWWPAGYGDQVLYDLRVELLAGGSVVDSLDARIGFREIELVTEPDGAFFFRVNGVPVYAKGANWIPDDSFPTRTTPARVRRLLELAKECGMNMIRIWGGGVYESADFYETCDELGLMVWQDFPFACAFYPEDDEFAAIVTAEATAAVRRLRNYTSLALWCGNNECQGITALLFGPDAHVGGARLYDETLPAVVAAEDAGRPYWPSSPWGRNGDPNSDDDGDVHYWNVWHGEGDWLHYAKCQARFVSEFGFAAPPDIMTLEECLDPGDLGVDTPAMRWHDKTGKGYETYLGFIALHYPMPATLPDLVYYGQLNQADAMRFGIEHFRRLRPRNMGTLVWQLNDCWPVQSWAWIDYQLRPKAAWYAARSFYAPLLLSLWRDGDEVVAHLVNDGAAGPGVAGALAVRAVDADGTVLWSVSVEAAVGGGGSVEALREKLPAEVLDASTHAVVQGSFAGVSSVLRLAEPKDLQLPVARVRLTASAVDGGAKIRVESDTLALSVHLWLEDIDATWSDNFFDLLPGEPREVLVAAGCSYSELVGALRWRSL